MSRIGKKKIDLPDGVEVKIDGQTIEVKGAKGKLAYKAHPDVTVQMKDRSLECVISLSDKKTAALWGTNRARVANMVKGVSEGFCKELELHGIGYRASLKGEDLELQVGYSHPVVVKAPAGIKFVVEKEAIKVEGIDIVLVGQVAADIRSVRKPEPYKGKGIRYKGERVRRKVGKVMGAAV